MGHGPAQLASRRSQVRTVEAEGGGTFPTPPAQSRLHHITRDYGKIWRASVSQDAALGDVG